eukprot:1612293-Rhodomonas_salina.5
MAERMWEARTVDRSREDRWVGKRGCTDRLSAARCANAAQTEPERASRQTDRREVAHRSKRKAVWWWRSLLATESRSNKHDKKLAD